MTPIKLQLPVLNSQPLRSAAELPPQPRMPSAPQTPLPTFKPGQVLDAKVIGPTMEQRLMLEIGGRQVETRSPVPLTAGQTLKVAVEEGPEGLLLRVLERGSSDKGILSEGVRSALPKQSPLRPLLQALTSVLTEAAGRGGKNDMPAGVRQAAQQLLNSIPTGDKLVRPEGLKQAVRDSGLFLEAKLAAGRPPGSGDLKALLNRLVALLQAQPRGDKPTTPTTAGADALRPPLPTGAPPPAPGAATGAESRAEQTAQNLSRFLDTALELLRQSDGALSRLKLHQMHTAPGQERQDPNWLLEIPMRQGKEFDTLELRIRRESRRNSEAAVDAYWSVTLSLDDRTYGPMHFVVSLVERRVSTTVWAEQPGTAELFRGEMERLRERFDNAGLEVGQLATRVGAPPREAVERSPIQDLVDVRA